MKRQCIKPDMPRVLGLSDQEFEATIVNMLRTLVDKVDKKQEQMGNVSREMDILRKNCPQNMLEIKNTVTEMRNAFGRFVRSLGTTEYSWA